LGPLAEVVWWLNGSPYTIKPLARRVDGPLIPAAPTDLIAALGALDRKLYIVPSKNLLVVRLGAATPAPDFDQQLWLRPKCSSLLVCQGTKIGA
jgi:hypothetical protein